MQNQNNEENSLQENAPAENAPSASPSEPQASAAPEAKPEEKQPEVKAAAVSPAPRHAGKAEVKKPRTYADIEKKKQLDSVKLWSMEVLQSQVKSKKCSLEMKEACEKELKFREHERNSKKKK